MTSAAPSRTLFFEVSRKALPRLLSQLDRQPFSPSSGSWHRGYWHQRLSDFSSSACQQGMLSLALLYGLEHEGNPLFRHSETLRWIDASIRALLREQHGDGSFDEWYPNERGWAGPTGYVIYALAKTWSLVGSGLEPELGLHVESACKKACAFLGKYEEIDVLANHQAMALLAVAQVRATFGAKLGGLDEAYEDLFRRFALSTRAQEGWSLEYDGADAGYQTASLSFLARVHALTQDERIEKIAGPMVDFVACFFFGEKSFGGVPGSRSTRNLFHLGLEYWAAHFPMAETLAFHSRRMLEAGALLEPMDQEDHYLLYRTAEMLESYALARPTVLSRGPLPCAQAGFHRVFAEAGVLATRSEGGYLVVNLKKGGALKALCSSGKLVEDAGWVLSKGAHRLSTNSCVRQDHRIEFSEYQVSVEGVATRFAHPLFTVWSFMAFRLTMKLLGFHPGAARRLKRWIRSRIMTGARAELGLQFKRVVQFAPSSKIAIHDLIADSHARDARALWLGGVFATRTVPQSKYFERHELENPVTEIDSAGLQHLRAQGSLETQRQLD